MVLVSYTGKEINAKLVFYGPGLCGKTTNLEYIYGSIPSTSRGKMVSMKTKTERTLFFDFLPIDLGELAGFKTRFLLYTVPGQVYYNATRKLVLKGVDAVVFVADSGRGKMDENIESFDNLKENLKEHGLSLDNIPYVLQYNKRDLPDVYSIEEMEEALNKDGVPYFEAIATKGNGVFDTFKEVSKLLLAKLSKEIGAPVNKPQQPAGPQLTAPRIATEPRVAAPPPKEAPPVVKPDMTTSQKEMPPAQTPQPVAQAPTPQPESPPRDQQLDPNHLVEQPNKPTSSRSAEDMPGQKSRGLWRWFKRDEEGESAVEGAKPAASDEPQTTMRNADGQVADESVLSEPGPVVSKAKISTSQAIDQESAGVEIPGLISTGSAKAPTETHDLHQSVPQKEEVSAGTVVAGSTTMKGSELTIPLEIPASLMRQNLVIRLEIKLAETVGDEDSNQKAA